MFLTKKIRRNHRSKNNREAEGVWQWCRGNKSAGQLRCVHPAAEREAPKLGLPQDSPGSAEPELAVLHSAWKPAQSPEICSSSLAYPVDHLNLDLLLSRALLSSNPALSQTLFLICLDISVLD